MTREIVQNLKFRKSTGTFDPGEFSAFIEQHYLSNNRSGSRQKKTFAPSSIGGYNGTCPRYWYLSFNEHEYEEHTDALGIANMSNGQFVHQRLEKMFEDANILIDKEVEIKLNDPPIRGFIDALIRWNNEVVVAEIKSMKQEKFVIRQSKMKPEFMHLIQMLIYLKATGKKSGFLYYENKNTQEFLVIPVEMNARNEKIIEEVFKWLRMVYKNYEEGGLPQRPFTKSSMPCKYCPLFDTCWTGEPGEVNIPAMEVPRN